MRRLLQNLFIFVATTIYTGQVAAIEPLFPPTGLRDCPVQELFGSGEFVPFWDLIATDSNEVTCQWYFATFEPFDEEEFINVLIPHKEAVCVDVGGEVLGSGWISSVSGGFVACRIPLELKDDVVCTPIKTTSGAVALICL